MSLWIQRSLENCTIRPLTKIRMANGIKVTSEHEDLEGIRRRVMDGLSQMWEEEKRFYNPHIHYMDMSPAMYQLKQDMLHMHGVKEVK